MGYKAKVILDSVSPSGHRLTTMEVTFPRFILAEMNTHRKFSRNSASSRAVPASKMIERVKTDPVIPLEWGINRPGMQASAIFDDYDDIRFCEFHWLEARDRAVEMAQELSDFGLHKQAVNRLLEPFLWHTAILSSTEWENFFKQRCSPLAQPEMRHTAELMRQVYTQSKPMEMPLGGWHLPYLRNEDNLRVDADRVKVSVARCARVSYLTHDGRRDVTEDFKLYGKLISADPPHLSPFEHAAVACADGDEHGNFDGWLQARQLVEERNPWLV